MSLKSMVTKLAIAFVAAKGAQAFSKAGGMDGVKRKLQEQQRSSGGSGSGGGLGGLLSGADGAGGGGLGGLLGQLGIGGSTSGGTGGGLGGLLGGGAAAGGLGGLLGGLAGASADNPAGGERIKGLLESTADAGVSEEAEAGLVIRAMIMAAKADGEIDEGERRALWEVLGDSDAEDQAFVEEALKAPVDAAALARDVPRGLELEVYTASVMAIEPDNAAEAQHLHALAQGMGLEESTVNEIHLAQGKPPLYSA